MSKRKDEPDVSAQKNKGEERGEESPSPRLWWDVQGLARHGNRHKTEGQQRLS